MSDGTPPSAPDPTTDPTVDTARRWPVSEDWAATIVGLVLLALVLSGAVPGWLVP